MLLANCWFSDSLGDPPGETYGEFMGDVRGEPEEMEQVSLKEFAIEDKDESLPCCNMLDRCREKERRKVIKMQ